MHDTTPVRCDYLYTDYMRQFNSDKSAFVSAANWKSDTYCSLTSIIDLILDIKGGEVVCGVGKENFERSKSAAR